MVGNKSLVLAERQSDPSYSRIESSRVKARRSKRRRGEHGYCAVTGLTPNTDRAAEELLMLLSVRFRAILHFELDK